MNVNNVCIDKMWVLNTHQGFHPGGKAFINPSAANGIKWGSESGSMPNFIA